MNELVKILNKEQKAAVEFYNGPLIVIAGAGSGKTKVLTTRIAYLIENYNVPPQNILAITFTNKASREMKDRLTKILGRINDITVSTFHSFALKCLRIYGNNSPYFDYKNNFSICDDQDAKKILKEIIDKEENIQDIRKAISLYKNSNLNIQLINDIPKESFFKIFNEYTEQLKKSNSMDFDDILLEFLLLLQKDLTILDKLSNKYKYILIDEFQDTNDIQFEIVKLISKKYNNVFVVGDSDQSIYKFRGANIKNLEYFYNTFPNSKIIKLEQNYRSSKNILNVANNLININYRNKEELSKFTKELKTDLYDGDIVTFKEFNTLLEQKDYIKNTIQHIGAYNYSDIAILVRTKNMAKTYEKVLLELNIRCRIKGVLSFLDKKVIKDLLAYLKVINNIEDEQALLRIINVPKRKIGTKTIDKIHLISKEKNISLYEALEYQEKTSKVKEIIDSLIDKSRYFLPSLLINEIVNITNIKKYYSDAHDENVNNEVNEFIEIVKNIENNGINTLTTVLDNLSLDNKEEDEESDGINILTVHSAKGLEFPIVILPDLEDGNFPFIKQGYESIEEIEEERRLFYVAITRAKEKLYLSCVKNRYFKANIRSRFVDEIKDQIEYSTSYNIFSDTFTNNKYNIFERDNFANENIEHNKEQYYNENIEHYNIGEIVYHGKFGKGKIINETEEEYIIEFNKLIGTKKIIKGIKALGRYGE